MNCKPTTEAEIWHKINSSFVRMSLAQRRLWEIIKIVPEKWEQDPYGKEGGGFWVVALIGNSVIWYNDLEDGFNRSAFQEYGKLGEYWANQDELEMAVQCILNEIKDGYDSAAYASPPRPGRSGGGGKR